MPEHTKLITVSYPQFRLRNPAQETILVEITGGDGKVAGVITLAQLMKVFNSSADSWELEFTTEEKPLTKS